MICGKSSNLILGPDQRQFGAERLVQCRGDDFRSNATRIAERDGNPGTLLRVLTT
jgi:hypothetical protein